MLRITFLLLFLILVILSSCYRGLSFQKYNLGKIQIHYFENEPFYIYQVDSLLGEGLIRYNKKDTIQEKFFYDWSIGSRKLFLVYKRNNELDTLHLNIEKRQNPRDSLRIKHCSIQKIDATGRLLFMIEIQHFWNGKFQGKGYLHRSNEIFAIFDLVTHEKIFEQQSGRAEYKIKKIKETIPKDNFYQFYRYGDRLYKHYSMRWEFKFEGKRIYAKQLIDEPEPYIRRGMKKYYLVPKWYIYEFQDGKYVKIGGSIDFKYNTKPSVPKT